MWYLKLYRKWYHESYYKIVWVLMEVVYSIFIGTIAGKIAGMIAGVGLQCRRDTQQSEPFRRALGRGSFENQRQSAVRRRKMLPEAEEVRSCPSAPR